MQQVEDTGYKEWYIPGEQAYEQAGCARAMDHWTIFKRMGS